MRRWILIAITGLILSCGVGAVLALNNLGTRLDIHAIPIYTGATNVQINDWKDSTGSQSGKGLVIVGSKSPGSILRGLVPRSDQRGGTIDFATTDSPQQVYAFYDSRLTKAGWTPFTRTSQPIAPNPTTSSSSTGSVSHIYEYNIAAPRLPWLGFLPRNHATIFVNADGIPVGAGSEVNVVLFNW
jgi:hypothetical protein